MNSAPFVPCSLSLLIPLEVRHSLVSDIDALVEERLTKTGGQV